MISFLSITLGANPKERLEGKMFLFTRSKKIIFTIVISTALCLVLSSFLPTVHSQISSAHSLPCRIDTYGKAWDGVIAYDLEIGSGFMGVGGTGNFLVVMNTNGTVLALRESATSYGGSSYNIAPNILMFQGEPQVDGASSAPTFATHFWNLSSGTTQDFPNVIGHHDIQYNPVNNTFLILQDYVRQVEGHSILFDKILQVDPNGNVIWSWDTYDHIPLSEASQFNELSVVDGQTVEDFTHTNTLDWHYNDTIIYLNARNTNTFYKINQTTGNLIWACGEFGNFTLLGANGQQVPSLWYHCHDVKEVAPDVFTLFDNDYCNNTNPNDCHSRIVELTLNETSMTAYVNWSWEAPTAYWASYAGGALLLPNGDFIGNFADPTHQNLSAPQNQPWNFNDTGAVLVEVNPTGQIVRTFTFSVGCYIYRIATVTNPTSIIFPTPTSTPTHATTPTPVNTPTPTKTPSLTATPTSTPLTSPSPTPKQIETSPALSPGSTLALVVVAIVIVAVIIAVIIKRKRKIKF